MSGLMLSSLERDLLTNKHDGIGIGIKELHLRAVLEICKKPHVHQMSSKLFFLASHVPTMV